MGLNPTIKWGENTMKTPNRSIKNVPRLTRLLVATKRLLLLGAALSVTPLVQAQMPIQNGGNIVVNGNGTVIDGANKSGFFVQAGNLTVANATLSNFVTTGGNGSGGGAGMGGAIFVNSGASVILNNVNFISDTAKGGAGGVGNVGGSLNNLFNNGTVVNQATSGYTPDQNTFTDIGGTTGTKGSRGSDNPTGIGGMGGNGGAGGDGGTRSASLILGVTTATLDIADLLTEEAADDASPFTLNVGAGLLGKIANAIINEANAIAALTSFDQSLANGQIGLGGTGGTGGNGGTGGDFFGGGAGGAGGNGGTGGKNWSGSAFQGGAAGGDAGNGGNGGLGGFGAGGGVGGAGGTGGGGAGFDASAGSPAVPAQTMEQTVVASYNQGYNDLLSGNFVVLQTGLNAPIANFTQELTPGDANTTVTVYTVLIPAHNITITTSPAQPAVPASSAGSRPNGLDGTGGAGGNGGFGGGAGASGYTPSGYIFGGSGGNAMGGAIFVRAGGSLIIQGNATFDNNQLIQGQGQAAVAGSVVQGISGITVGSDLYMMTGSNVILDPGEGNTITFNGNPYGTSIADDSAASMGPSGGTSSIPSGQGAGITIASGLVIFNGADTYSGETKITGGVLQAIDTVGVYFDSRINIAGGIFQSNGSFNRYVGTATTDVEWTGNGGFAAQGGDLVVSLSGGSKLTWGSGSFVPNGSVLVFGSESADSNVTFVNNIDLGGQARTILVTANNPIDATDFSEAVDANVDNAILLGAISNGSLIVGDATHTGTLLLGGRNTYTGNTTVLYGTLGETGNGSISDSSNLTVNGTTAAFDLGANHSDTVRSVTLDGNGAITGTGNSTLTSTTTFELMNGTVTAGLGGSGIPLNKTTGGLVTLDGNNTYTGNTTVTAGTLAEGANGSIADTSNLTVNGSTAQFDLGANHSDTVGTVTLDGNASITGTGNSSLGSSTSFELKNGTVTAGLSGNNIPLNKTTGGLVTLDGNNTYTGNTTVTAGTLAEGANGSIADTSNLTVNGSTAVFDLGANHSDTVATVTLDGHALINGTGNSALGSSTSFEVKNGTVAAILSGNNIPLNKTTSGIVELLANNTYTGNTTITAGTLAEAGVGTLADGSNLTVNGTTAVFDLGVSHNDTVGTVTLDNGGLITATGLGLSLPNANSSTLTSTTSYELKNGTVLVNLAGSGIALNKTTNATVTLGGTNTYTGNTTITAGTLAENANGSIADSSNLTVNGTTAVFALGANHSDTVGLVTLDGNGSITGSGNSALTSTTSFEVMNGTVTASLSGNNIPLNKTTNGTVTLSGANSYTGNTTVTAGTLAESATGSLADGSNLTVNGTTAQFDLGANHSDTVGLVTLDGNGSITGSGNSALTSTTRFELDNGTVTAILSGGNIPLNKATNGTVTLSGNNTYTGNTTVTAGALVESATGFIADGSNLIVNGSTASFDLGANHSDTVATVTLDGNGVLNGTGNSTLSSAASFEMKNGTVNAILGGGAGLNKTTNGTVTLNANNTYTGNTTVSAGTLVVSATGNLAGGGAVSVAQGAELDLNHDLNVANLSAGGTLGGTGTLTAANYNLTDGALINAKLGNGTVTSNGNVSINASVAAANISIQTGMMTLEQPDLLNHQASVDITTAAKLVLGNGNTTILNLTGNGTVISNNFTLTVTNGGSYNGTLSSPGSLDKTGDGNLSLDGNSTFSSGTNITTGNLIVNGTLDTPNVTIGNGGMLGGHGTVTGDVFDNGGTTSPGNSPGVLTIAGNYVEAGTLLIEIGGTSGPGVNPTGYDQVVVGGTTTLDPSSTLQLVKFTAYEPARGDTFKIINGAAGSIFGHFGSVTSNFTNDLIFNVATGEVVGTGLAAGSNLAGSLPGLNGSQRNYLSKLQIADHQYAGGDTVALMLQNPGAMQQVLNENSPEAYAGFVDYAARTATAYRDSAIGLDPIASTGRFEIFAGYSHYNGGSDASQNQADYDLNSDGAIAGGRVAIIPKLSLGVFYGYNTGSVDSTYLSTNVTGNIVGGFAVFDPLASHRLTVTGSMTYGDFSTKGTRKTFAGSSTIPKVGSSEYLGTVAVKYVALQREKYSLTPELAVSYGDSSVKAFTETNANTMEQLHVGKMNYSSVILDGAVNGAYALTAKLEATARLGVSHNFLKTSRDVNANVVGESTAFTVNAPGMGDTEYHTGIGLNYNVVKGLSLHVFYQAGFSTREQLSNSVTVGASFNF